jgi:cyanophycinase
MLAVMALLCSAEEHSSKYFRVGNAADAAGHPRPGYALMGGGEDLDEAFQWLCARAGGGDFLVLRATGTDAYNPYIQKLCPKLNSVATLVIPSREAAGDPEVARKIAEASALFLSGGDQANYVRFWAGTPVQTALNEAIQRGIPLGGTSAGLAVMGEWGYSAEGDRPNDPDLDSKTALADPWGERMTLVHGLLKIPVIDGVVTDTHFAKRDRMGRLLAFIASLGGIRRGGAIRGVGVDEGAAVLTDQDGRSRIVGRGIVYFIEVRGPSWPIYEGNLLTSGPYSVQKVAPGQSFDLKSWRGDGLKYRLSIKDGKLESKQAGGAIY